MKSLKFFLPFIAVILLPLSLPSCNGEKEDKTANFLIGWASGDITPDKPVLIRGQFHARVSEGVLDPITVTALALESVPGPSSEKVIMISCDLTGIDDDLRNNVRNLLRESLPELRPEQIVLNATHTHAGPVTSSFHDSRSIYGVELDVMSPYECQKFIAERIAITARQAWDGRQPGGISYGFDHAVVSHNRLQVGSDSRSRMYGSINRPEFSHIEGYEDHSLNLLYTWDNRSNLTGVVINVASPSQGTESIFELSADFWHDTRVELNERLGRNIFVLAQCSAAGDQSPHVMVEIKAEERMQQLKFPDVKSGRGSMARRKQIASRIVDPVTSLLPVMKENIEWDPVFAHKMEVVNLSRRLIGMDDVNSAVKESEAAGKKFEEMLNEIKENPAMKDKPRWYTDITRTHTVMRRGQNVKERYELEKVQPKFPTEVHVIRIGDIVIATNQFELYLDYAIRIKGRSPAIQTFIVQLTGNGSYLPTSRSIAGGAYGAVPASTLIGPEGGVEFVESTLELINALWE